MTFTAIQCNKRIRVESYLRGRWYGRFNNIVVYRNCSSKYSSVRGHGHFCDVRFACKSLCQLGIGKETGRDGE